MSGFVLNLDLGSGPVGSKKASGDKAPRGRAARAQLQKTRVASKAKKDVADCNLTAQTKDAALEHMAREANAETKQQKEAVRKRKRDAEQAFGARKGGQARNPLQNERLTGDRKSRGISDLFDGDSGSSSDEAPTSREKPQKKSDRSEDEPRSKRQRVDKQPKVKKSINFSKLEAFKEIEFFEDTANEIAETSRRQESQQQKLFGDGTLPVESFTALKGISQRMADSLKSRMSIERPTLVQQRAIPHLLAGRDCLIRAETGSGKTLSFVIPLIERLHASSTEQKITREHGTLGLIIAPTRELVLQLYSVLQEVCNDFKFLVPGYLVGGEKKKSEKARLRKGVTLLVATPGRLLDHLQTTKSFVSSNLSVLVLDEADRLLDMGFEQDIQSIVDILRQRAAGKTVSQPSELRSSDHPFQTILCSATLPSGIARLAGMSLKKPVPIDIVAEQQELRESLTETARDSATSITPDTLTQFYTVVPVKHKLEALAAFLFWQTRLPSPMRAIIFVASKDEVEFLHAVLGSTNVRTPMNHDKSASDQDKPAKAVSVKEAAATAEEHALLPNAKLYRLHGSLSQTERAAVFDSFMSKEPEVAGKHSIMFTTDVAARGLDFPGVNWIVQYDAPLEPAEYVHRVGRTARLGSSGRALLFLQPHELGFLGFLHEQTGLPRECVKLMMASEILSHLNMLPERGHDEDAVQAEQVKLDEAAEKKKIRDHLKMLKDTKQLDEGEVFEGDEDGTIAERLVGDLPSTTTVLQWQIMRMVGDSEDLQHLASKAFASSIRAYATFPRELKDIFSVRRLHLGHLARSFGLKSKPSDIVSVSASGHVRTKFVPRGGEADAATEKRHEPKKARKGGQLNSLRSAKSITAGKRSAHVHTTKMAIASEFASGY